MGFEALKFKSGDASNTLILRGSQSHHHSQNRSSQPHFLTSVIEPNNESSSFRNVRCAVLEGGSILWCVSVRHSHSHLCNSRGEGFLLCA